VAGPGVPNLVEVVKEPKPGGSQLNGLVQVKTALTQIITKKLDPAILKHAQLTVKVTGQAGATAVNNVDQVKKKEHTE